ncbi:5724_t:CDS:2 [Ambispora leptoticha]|uniref:5724_t:CDS:1 n=1 Tax=Ambispora leptoticha TaxID=144679 RepID=A0A9N9AJH1_9GLOM|nr:5724_t:CDS:2 [Ambispora leptoticha]
MDMSYFNFFPGEKKNTASTSNQEEIARLKKELHQTKQENEKLKDQVNRLSREYEQSERDLKENNDLLKKIIEDLDKKAADYQSEAAHYQSELGGIKNLQEESNIIKLEYEIKELKNALQTLTTAKKRKVNQKEVKKLLDKYQLEYEKPPNGIINAVMQRHLFNSIYELVLKEMEKIFSINPAERTKFTEKAVKTIQKCIMTLFFNIKLQYPSLEIVWLEKNCPVNDISMDLTWDDIEDNAIVEICKFPLIQEISTKKIIFKAQVEIIDSPIMYLANHALNL